MKFFLSYLNLAFTLLRATYYNLNDIIARLYRWYKIMDLRQLFILFPGLTIKSTDFLTVTAQKPAYTINTPPFQVWFFCLFLFVC